MKTQIILIIMYTIVIAQVVWQTLDKNKPAMPEWWYAMNCVVVTGLTYAIIATIINVVG